MAKAVIKGTVGLDTKGVDVALSGLRQRSLSFASRFGGIGGRMGSQFAAGFAKFGPAGIIAAVAVGLAALGGLVAKAGIAAYAKIETITTQFKVLFRDVEQAKAHLMDLRDFAAKTPFQLNGIAKASRLLFNFSEGALGGRDSLRLVGDAAAATSNQIEDVSMWVGRAYGAIKAGRPFGEAAQRLQEMGILTASTRNRLEQMQKTGADGAAIWRVLTGELKRYEGGMEELSGTIAGKSSTIKDNWQNMLASLGEMFAPVWKSIQDMIIGTLENITTAIQKTHELFRTIKLWRDSDMSWAEARKQSEKELQGLREQRKKDQMEMQMDDTQDTEAEQKRIDAERKAMEKEAERLQKDRSDFLKEKLQADNQLQRQGAGGVGERIRSLQDKMQGGAAFGGAGRNTETRLLRDQYAVQQQTLSTLQRQNAALEQISRNTAEWSVT